MKGFVKAFENIGYKHDWMTVFQDLLTLSICVFGMQRYEDEYFETINRYSKEDQKLFPILFTEMVRAYEDGASIDGAWRDILGDMYMEIGSRSKHQMMGQFFTPQEVCTMMASMTIGSDQKTNINDCACGSGRILIAASRLQPNNRFNMFFVGQDIDLMVCKMAVINFVMFGMKGVIINMDTLKMEVRSGWRIYLPETGLGVVKLNADQALSYLIQPKEEIKPEAPVIQMQPMEYKQLKLFS